MRREYCPGSSFAAGNRNRPWSSVTTVTVVDELAFFALTSTPSIGPSAAEVTWPDSVPGDGVWPIRTIAKPKLAASSSRRVRINLFQAISLFIFIVQDKE